MSATVWTAPDLDRPWYPVAGVIAPERHRHIVIHAAGDGWQQAVRLVRDIDRGLWVWEEWRPAVTRFAALVHWRVPTPRDPARWRDPVHWQPLTADLAAAIGLPHDAPIAWPDPLPEPVTRHPARRPPPPIEDATDEASTHATGALGCMIPPATAHELEARLVLALRTEAVLPRPGIARSSYAGDIPREMIDIARRYALGERVIEALQSGRALGADETAPPPPFKPSRRDLTDWDYALGWMRALDAREVSVARLRALDPPFSWRAIGERVGLSGEGARREFRGAVDVMFRRYGAKGD